MSRNSLPPPTEEIDEQPNYLSNILLPAVRDIDIAIMNNKQALDSAENLLSNLVEDWDSDIGERVKNTKETYDSVIEEGNKILRIKGIPDSQKAETRRMMETAEKDYARKIKRISLSLIHKKIGLFKVQKAIDRGYLSLYVPPAGGVEVDD